MSGVRVEQLGNLRSLAFAVRVLRGKDNRIRLGSACCRHVANKLEQMLLDKRRYAAARMRRLYAERKAKATVMSLSVRTAATEES